MSIDTVLATTTIQPKTLKTVLAGVSGAVGKVYSLPILAGVNIGSHDGQLAFETYDLDVGVRITLDLPGIPGVVAPFRPLVALAAEKTPVTFYVVDGELTVVSGRVTIRPDVKSIIDWPRNDYDDITDLGTFDLDAAVMCANHTSPDTTRPALQSVQIGAEQYAGTDSYRLHVEPVHTRCLPFVCPAHVIHVAKKAGLSGLVDVGFGTGHVQLSGDTSIAGTSATVTVRGRTAQVDFPNWKEIVGTPPTATLVDRDQWATATATFYRLASKLTDYNGVALCLTTGDGQARFHLRDGQQLDVEAGPWPGEDIAIGLNPAFLIDAIKADTGPLVIHWTPGSDARPIILTGNRGTTHLLMPVRTS